MLGSIWLFSWIATTTPRFTSGSDPLDCWVINPTGRVDLAASHVDSLQGTGECYQQNVTLEPASSVQALQNS
jgi:hypothetical protein